MKCRQCQASEVQTGSLPSPRSIKAEDMRNLGANQLLRLLCVYCGMCCLVVWWIRTSVSDEAAASIFIVEIRLKQTLWRHVDTKLTLGHFPQHHNFIMATLRPTHLTISVSCLWERSSGDSISGKTCICFQSTRRHIPEDSKFDSEWIIRGDSNTDRFFSNAWLRSTEWAALSTVLQNRCRPLYGEQVCEKKHFVCTWEF